MNFFKKLRPATIVVGVLLIIGVVDFLVMRQLKSATETIVKDTLPGLSYGGKANAEVAGNFVRTLLVVSAASDDERQALLQQISETSSGVATALKTYEGSIFELEDRRLFDVLMKQRGKYLQIRQSMFGLITTDKRDEALRLFKTELLPAYTEYTRACDAVFSYNMHQADARGRDIMRVCTITQLLVVIIGIAVFIGGVLTPFWAIASLKEPRL